MGRILSATGKVDRPRRRTFFKVSKIAHFRPGKEFTLHNVRVLYIPQENVQGTKWRLVRCTAQRYILTPLAGVRAMYARVFLAS
jgi:hypothetical protein